MQRLPWKRAPLQPLLDVNGNANGSQFRKIKLLYSECVREEGRETCAFICLFSSKYLPAVAHRCVDLLFYDKLDDKKSHRRPSCLYCMFTALLFHPQQVCLPASVNHDGGLLAALLGSG